MWVFAIAPDHCERRAVATEGLRAAKSRTFDN